MGDATQREDLADLVCDWPDPSQVSLIATSPTEVLGRTGDTSRVSRVASISKLLVALTALVAMEEGTIALDDAAGPRDSTVRHLLAHASGLAFDEHRQIARPGQRRIYSNAGIEQLAEHIGNAAQMDFERYQYEAVIEPLHMNATTLEGSPAAGIRSNVDDLASLARELLRPTLLARATLAEATSVHFEDLRGVLPGFGRFDPNPWGLGIEIRGGKLPHWTAPSNHPSTFGHFGGSGTYLWVDPTRDLAAIAISGTEFGPWATTAWPVANEAIVSRFSRTG